MVTFWNVLLKRRDFDIPAERTEFVGHNYRDKHVINDYLWEDLIPILGEATYLPRECQWWAVSNNIEQNGSEHHIWYKSMYPFCICHFKTAFFKKPRATTFTNVKVIDSLEMRLSDCRPEMQSSVSKMNQETTSTVWRQDQVIYVSV